MRPHASARRAALVAAAAALAALPPAGALGVTSRIGVDDVAARAAAGTAAPAILREAFPATSLATGAPAHLDVLVADLVPRAIVASSGAARLRVAGRTVALATDHRYAVTRTSAGWRVRDLDGRLRLRAPAGALRFAPAAPGGTVRLVEPLDRRFRGAFTLRAGERRTIAVINRVTTEAWVAGAAGGEAPGRWLTGPPASMDVAAIVARSRAAAAAANGRPGWDLTSDDVLYLGVDGERPVTLDAATRTARRILTSEGVPVAPRIPFAPSSGDGVSPDPGRPLPVAAAPARPIAGAPPGLGGRAVALAQGLLGTPYRWGGAAPGGFDCSGLVFWVYGRLGITLPRVAEQQGRVGVPVASGELLPGDVVFFADSSGYVHHEGIFLGGGRMIHAPQTGAVVRVERIDTGYYARQYAGARRFSPTA